MTVIEKIHQLRDERDTLLCFGKSYDPEIKARLASINDKLDEIRRTCPASWERSGR